MEHPLEGTTQDPRSFGGAPDPVSDEEREQASPEEQEDYELLVVRSRKMMFGKGKEKILTLLGSSESPAKGIGKAGAMLIKSLIQSSKEQGRVISPEAAVNAAASVAEDLNELAKANGVFTYDSPEDEEKELKEGVLWGVKLYGDGMIESGELSQEISKLAQEQVKGKIAEELAQGPQKTKVAQAVGEAVNPKPQGLIGGAMEGEM